MASADSATLVRSMVELGQALGQALGLQMVVEGIERLSQLDALQPAHCPVGQGFLLGRPQPAQEIHQLLLTGPAARR